MTCLWCGIPLETANPRARYCSAAHRAMAHRNGPRATPITSGRGDRRSKAGGEITAIVAEQLRGLDLGPDHLADAALTCARAIDSAQTPPSALPGLTKALMDLMGGLREREANR